MKLLWSLCALVACSTPASPEATVSQALAIGPDLDILFVIDDSASTSDKQTLLMEDIPSMLQQLDSLAGGRPNLHIGVITTTVDIGVGGFGGCPSPDPIHDGRLLGTRALGAPEGCPAPTGPYIIDVAQADGTRQVNYTGTLEDTLSCIGQVGSTGCGFEAPLEAMKRALDGTRPENAGFLRPGATLAVVILTDEDDASVADPVVFSLPAADAGPGDFRVQPLFAYACDTPITLAPGTFTNCQPRTDSYLRPPADYADFLTSLDGPSQVVVALIAGDVQATVQTAPLIQNGMTQTLALLPSCQVTTGGGLALGRPAIRLRDFLGHFGDNGIFQSVCQADYSSAMTGAGHLMGEKLNSCLASELAGLDPLRCTVTEGPLTIPTCQSTAGAGTCWTVVADAACTTPSQLALHVERVVPPAATYDRVTCTPQRVTVAARDAAPRWIRARDPGARAREPDAGAHPRVRGRRRCVSAGQARRRARAPRQGARARSDAAGARALPRGRRAGTGPVAGLHRRRAPRAAAQPGLRRARRDAAAPRWVSGVGRASTVPRRAR